jgi:hypothetical protein
MQQASTISEPQLLHATVAVLTALEAQAGGGVLPPVACAPPDSLRCVCVRARVCVCVLPP